MTEHTDANRGTSRLLMTIGWIILGIGMLIAIVLRCTDQYGFITGFMLMFVFPVLALAATATATAGSVHGYWLGLAAAAVEIAILASATRGIDVFALYGGITLACAAIGYGIGRLLHRHFHRSGLR